MYMMLLLQLVIYHIPKQWNPQNESNLTLTATANSIPHDQIWWQQPNADKKKYLYLPRIKQRSPSPQLITLKTI